LALRSRELPAERPSAGHSRTMREQEKQERWSVTSSIPNPDSPPYPRSRSRALHLRLARGGMHIK